MSITWDSLAVQYGIGAFETMRMENGRIALWDYHYQRLKRAISSWGLSEEELKVAISGLESVQEKNCRLKLFIGLHSERKLISHIYLSSLELRDSSKRLLLQTNRRALEQVYKTSQYSDHYFSYTKARSQQCDDVLYESINGHLLECSRAAILVLSEDRGYLSQGPILKSVTRQKLFDEKGNFWKLKERILLDELGDTEFLCTGNAVEGLRAVNEVIDEKGRCRYKKKVPNTLIDKWNQFLFS